MRFIQKDLEVPLVCLDLGFEDRSCHREPSARMYNPQRDLTLWVSGLSAGERRYVLQDSDGDVIGNCETDNALRELVASARMPSR